MITVRSPLRLSFVGGGSDLPSFCSSEDGHVISSTIHQSVYISIINRYDDKIRVSYSVTELVDKISDIRHDIVRETLMYLMPGWFQRGIEIVSMADLSHGAGLGSSGAFTVGLVHALCSDSRRYTSPDDLIKESSRIEIDICKRSSGYQDQSASAIGGLNLFTFRGSSVFSERIEYSDHVRDLEDRLILVDTGIRGDSSDILHRQSLKIDYDSRSRATIRSMSNLAVVFRNALVDGNIDECGEIMDASWWYKRSSVDGMSSDRIDDMYSFAKEHGAIGAKLCGAGGRGMILLLAQKNRTESLSESMYHRWGSPVIIPRFYPYGSQVVYSS